MPTDPAFGSFRRRITRSYVLLALILLLVVAGTSSVLALFLYARTLDEAVTTAAKRVPLEVATRAALHRTLAQDAPRLVAAIGRNRLRVLVFDAKHTLLSGSHRVNASRHGIVEVFSEALGLHSLRVPIVGGTVVIAPDLDRFAVILVGYWSVMIPVAFIATLVAWFVGQRITERAVRPLDDVVQALQRIADGDFGLEPVATSNHDLASLTVAYNNVAHRLTTAFAQRERSEVQMRQFIADAGHELRTPLTVIMGYLDVLEANIVRDADGVARVYGTMREESRRMRGLVEKLIFLARLERPRSRPCGEVDVGDVAARVVAALTRPEERVRVRIEVTSPACVVADDSDIYEAVRNLVDNALKYAAPSAVRLNVRTDLERVHLTVADSGPGMDAQDLEHVFDRFYRGSARGEIEGSGLGLAIVKRAVEHIGGTIDVESRLGAGTAIHLALPRAHGDANRPSFPAAGMA